MSPSRRLNYTLEVMKNGQIMETKEVSDKDHFTFGRSPASDVVLEHPSSSRLHAVLQYRGADGQAFLYDAGSAHGTFLNKKQIGPKTPVPLRYTPAGLLSTPYECLCQNSLFTKRPISARRLAKLSPVGFSVCLMALDPAVAACSQGSLLHSQWRHRVLSYCRQDV